MMLNRDDGRTIDTYYEPNMAALFFNKYIIFSLCRRLVLCIHLSMTAFRFVNKD